MEQDLRGYVEARKPLPKVIFPEGVYNFSTWPNLAIPSLRIVGDGEVYLCHTGSGPAMVLDGDSTGPYGGGKFNLELDRLNLVPGPGTTDSLSLYSIHHSYVRMRVLGAGLGCKAVAMYWCVLTELYNYSISPFDALSSPIGGGNMDCIGLWLDKVTTPSDWQTTACRFTNPIIESVRTGIHIEDAGGIQFTGGTVEGCTGDGFVIKTGGNNQTWNLWFEGNAGYDVIFGIDSHDNRLVVTNPNAKVRNDAIVGTNDNVVTSPSDLN
jgi:hypothetical protein